QMCDGELSDEHCALLDAALQNDASARWLYLEFVENDALMRQRNKAISFAADSQLELGPQCLVEPHSYSERSDKASEPCAAASGFRAAEAEGARSPSSRGHSSRRLAGATWKENSGIFRRHRTLSFAVALAAMLLLLATMAYWRMPQ